MTHFYMMLINYLGY